MRYPEGQFSWTDLMTPEPEQARTFYSGLFGWDAKDMQTPTGPPYTMFLLHGQVVAGLGSQPLRLREAGIPPAWTSYINVENLERTIGRAIESGGTVTMEPMGVSPEGRMAMIADPSGAVVGLWQPEEHQGVDLRDAPGAMSWNELQTRDLDLAARFYLAVFGWQWITPGDTGYLVATLESKEGSDKSVAGAMSMPPAVPPQVSSYWSVYFEVADCDASTWLATELGGQTLVPPMEVGDMRFSGITDPSGAMFMLLSGTQSSR
jgi:predicted enzyme related to lactoylglutathione lyase